MKRIVLIAVLFATPMFAQYEPVRMHGQVSIASAFYGHSAVPGYMEFIDGGFEIVLFDAPAWTEGEIEQGHQSVWILYKKDPILRISVSGLFLSLAPSDPTWRRACVDLDKNFRWEERQVSTVRTADKLSIKFLLK